MSITVVSGGWVVVINANYCSLGWLAVVIDVNYYNCMRWVDFCLPIIVASGCRRCFWTPINVPSEIGSVSEPQSL